MLNKRRRILEVLCLNSNLYTPVEYIISNGKAIIDTGITPDDTTIVEYTGTISLTRQMSIMGCIDTNRFHFYSHVAATSEKYFYTGTTGYPFSTIDTTIRARYTMKKGGLYVNDELKVTSNNSISGSQSIWIFNCNNNGKPNTSVTGQFKCYGVKLWKQGVLVRNMIPVVDTKGNACLFDLVESKFYYDINGGSFGYVSDVWKEVYAIQSTGTQWIDTEIPIFNYDTWKIKLNVEFTSFYNYVALLGTESGVTTHESWADANKKFFLRYNNVRTPEYYVNARVPYEFIYEFDGKSIKVYNGDVLLTQAQVGTGKLNSPLYLFRRTTQYGRVKFFGAQLYGDGKLLADYIPAMDSNLDGFIYDKVQKKKIYSYGSSNFEAIETKPNTYADIWHDFSRATSVNSITTNYGLNGDTAVKNGTGFSVSNGELSISGVSALKYPSAYYFNTAYGYGDSDTFTIQIEFGDSAEVSKTEEVSIFQFGNVTNKGRFMSYNGITINGTTFDFDTYYEKFKKFKNTTITVSYQAYGNKPLKVYVDDELIISQNVTNPNIGGAFYFGGLSGTRQTSSKIKIKSFKVWVEDSGTPAWDLKKLKEMY